MCDIKLTPAPPTNLRFGYLRDCNRAQKICRSQTRLADYTGGFLCLWSQPIYSPHHWSAAQRKKVSCKNRVWSKKGPAAYNIFQGLGDNKCLSPPSGHREISNRAVAWTRGVSSLLKVMHFDYFFPCQHREEVVAVYCIQLRWQQGEGLGFQYTPPQNIGRVRSWTDGRKWL